MLFFSARPQVAASAPAGVVTGAVGGEPGDQEIQVPGRSGMAWPERAATAPVIVVLITHLNGSWLLPPGCGPVPAPDRHPPTMRSTIDNAPKLA